jgi:hypothetical protein
MESNQEQFAFTAFERLFKERGLPQAIRSDKVCHLLHPMGYSISPGYLSGGCAWASVLNESSPAIHSKTAGMSACI